MSWVHVLMENGLFSFLQKWLKNCGLNNNELYSKNVFEMYFHDDRSKLDLFRFLASGPKLGRLKDPEMNNFSQMTH